MDAKLGKAWREMTNRLTKFTMRYAVVLSTLQLVFNRRFPGAATDGVTLYVNPDYFLRLTPPQRQGLVIHELDHVIGQHPLRIRVAGMDHHLANIAGDKVINEATHNHEGAEIPPDLLFDETARGLSMEQVYRRDLEQQQREQESDDGNDDGGEPDTDPGDGADDGSDGDQGSGDDGTTDDGSGGDDTAGGDQGDGPDDGDGAEGGDGGDDEDANGSGDGGDADPDADGDGDGNDAGGNADGDGGNGDASDDAGDGSEPGSGDDAGDGPAIDWYASDDPTRYGVVLPLPEDVDPEEWADDFEVTLAQADTAERIRSIGDASAAARLEVVGPAEATVDWRSALSAWLSAESAGDYSYEQLDTEAMHMGVFCPDLYERTLPKVLVSRDVSGSVSNHEFLTMAEELGNILATFGCAATVVDCDASITSVVEIEAGQDFPTANRRTGCGGTRVQPIVDFIRESDETYIGWIHFSDMGIFDWPSENDVDLPVFWLSTRSTEWLEANPEYGPQVGEILHCDCGR